ncbi:hypothetical protein BC826DRAFT_264659 [Russula brevipes]|nr:hypothetical protein BC826DRAFT_264659 [Russula brevipes]
MTRCPPLLSPPLSLPPAAPPPLGPPPAAADQTFEVPPKPPPLQDNERREPRSIICASFTEGTMRAELPGREKPRQGLADDLCALRGECAARAERPNASTPRWAPRTCGVPREVPRRHRDDTRSAQSAPPALSDLTRAHRGARRTHGAPRELPRRHHVDLRDRRVRRPRQATKREHIAAGTRLPESQHITATCAICAECVARAGMTRAQGSPCYLVYLPLVCHLLAPFSMYCA